MTAAIKAAQLAGTPPQQPATRIVARSVAPETPQELRETAAQVATGTVTERSQVSEYRAASSPAETVPGQADITYQGATLSTPLFTAEEAGASFEQASPSEEGSGYQRFAAQTADRYAENQQKYSGQFDERGEALDIDG
ncbi:MAG: hypothetical protein ACPGO3_09055 [Magnetospiraceae bacterium]